MIRYIHIGSQIIEGNQDFAFWDTIQDRFVEFSEEQVFENIQDFKDHYKTDNYNGTCIDGSQRPIERYIKLIPSKNKLK